MFQQLEFAISSFAEDRSAKGFHNLFNRDGGACELVLCRTKKKKISSGSNAEEIQHTRRDQMRLEDRVSDEKKGEREKEIPIPTGWRST